MRYFNRSFFTLLAIALVALATSCSSEDKSHDGGVAGKPMASTFSISPADSRGYAGAPAEESKSLVLVEGEVDDESLEEYVNSAKTPVEDPSDTKEQVQGALESLDRVRSKLKSTGRPMAKRKESLSLLRESLEKKQEDGAIATSPAFDAKQGELWARLPASEDKAPVEIAFPLRHTDVNASISAYVASTVVTQSFENPFDENIEAVYVFPLPENSAVNGFVMAIGERKIIGIIKRKAEAREIYNKAKSEGHTASLLEQNRPNIFTQSVANIMPQQQVDIQITYFHRLKRDGDSYEWHFPMVVGPRYAGHTPDIDAITPKAVPEGMRNGHDIGLKVNLDAGVDIYDLKVPSHDVNIEDVSESQKTITLSDKDTIPNRDFVLRYRVFGEEIDSGVMTHASDRGGFVSLMLTPPIEADEKQIAPREITFVMDVSGSMRGKPLDISKGIVKTAIQNLRPSDYFNIFFFAGSNGQLWELPKPNTPANVEEGLTYLDGLKGGGGTEMLAGLRRLFNSERDTRLLRMVVFLTDGYVGNESQIISDVKENVKDSRFYALAIGSSVNRYLIDGIGRHGRGYSEVVLNRDVGETKAVVDRFYSRIDAPLWTDIEVDWNGLPVHSQFPANVPDLFKGHPLSVVAKYTGSAEGEVIIKGRKNGVWTEMKVPVLLPDRQETNAALEPIWARAKIEELSDTRYGTRGKDYEDLTEQITVTALEHNLVSESTSFVAVDYSSKSGDGKPKRVDVPVEQPEDVDRETTRPNER